MKQVLSGNEAIARGAWEAGCHFAAAYPGTPSTEILENCARYEEMDAQWAVNEKTAFETAAGASMGGARALVAQKHVGLNVAADPLFTMAYLGVSGGFVVVSADDPGMHSSQNEQDNRHYARAAKIPLLEPSDSQEAKDLVKQAFEISERFDTPVLFRTTTRVCHSKSVVEVQDRTAVELRPFERNARFLCLPSVARKLHVKVEQRCLDLAEFASSFPGNKVTKGEKAVGIIASGIGYQYAQEVFPEASFLHLTMSWPFPERLVREFASTVDRLLVVEEGDPFIEEQIKALGVACAGKEFFGILGEYSAERIREGLAKALPKRFTAPAPYVKDDGVAAAERPPVLCPGCPHRSVFRILGKMKVFVTGDIGCYTLGALPPLEALHTCLCMGGGVTVAGGVEKARKNPKEVVGVVGDSTFLHSGITGLIDMVYNGSAGTILILDNDITAMTGHQQNPSTGLTLKGKPAPRVDIPGLCRACGVKHVRVVDPYDMKATEEVLREEVARGELSVVVAKHPCVLILKDHKPETKLVWVEANCKACGMCLKIGCPAQEKQPGNPRQPQINYPLCVHCGQCAQQCKFDALQMVKEDEQ